MDDSQRIDILKEIKALNQKEEELQDLLRKNNDQEEEAFYQKRKVKETQLELDEWYADDPHFAKLLLEKEELLQKRTEDEVYAEIREIIAQELEVGEERRDKLQNMLLEMEEDKGWDTY